MDEGVDEVERWFAAAGGREEQLRRTDALVVEAAPGFDRQLVPMGAGRMLGHGVFPHRPVSAEDAVMWPLIALANQERHLSLHVSAVRDGQYLVEARADRLG